MTRLTFELPGARVDAADTDSRRISGIAVPYGQPGRTSAGTLTVQAGALRLPDTLGHVKLTYGHDRERAIGAALSADDTADALAMSFGVARTPDGDRLLAELDPATPVRDGLSVELDNVELSNGEVTAADLVAVAAVPLPAFTAARATIAAERTPDPMPDTTSAAPPAADVTAADDTPTVVTATPRDPAKHPLDVLAASIRAGLRPAQVEAALADYTDHAAATQPQWVGELWQATYDRRPFIDAVQTLPLTSTKVTGWRWVNTLEVDSWAGGKTAVPSNVPSVQAAEATAVYLAGGIDIAREWVDLGSPDILRSLIAQAMRDYRKKSEAAALTAGLAGATALPANADSIGQLTDVVIALGDAGADLDYLFVAGDVGRDIMTNAAGFDFLAGLARLNGDGELGGQRYRILPGLPAGTVLAGDREAFTFYEKNPPVTVSAVDIARGGLDEAVHGYYATLVNDATGIVKVAKA